MSNVLYCGDNLEVLAEYVPSESVDLVYLEQAKDVPDDEVIAAIRETRGRHGVPQWATTWDVLERLRQYPPAVVMAKLESLRRRLKIDGCHHGNKPPYCRGDWEVVGDDLDPLSRVT